MTTAILSALPEEQSGLLAALQQPQRSTHAGRAFWRGTVIPLVRRVAGAGA